MDSMQFLYLLAGILVINMVIVAFLLFYIPQTLPCEPGDETCMSLLDELRSDCTPSTYFVNAGNSTNNLTIKVTRYWDGRECHRKEEVVEDANSEITFYDITGYETDCAISPEDFEKYGHLRCNGSLLPFVSPGSVGEGSDFTPSGGSGGVYSAYCSIGADDCTAEAATYVTNCNEAEIILDQEIGNTLGGVSYWTLYMTIERLPVEYTATQKLPERCQIYHELINAVNLPPEIPPHVIGMNMTCTVDLSYFPISGISIRWCTGDLVEHIQLIYP